MSKAVAFTTRRCRNRVVSLVEPLEGRVLLSADVLSSHNDPGNTGQQLSEFVLNPTNVGSTNAAGSVTTNFGRVFDTTLDGQVFAQVLAKANVNVTAGSQGIHNVLYVATMHDSLYAVDANTGTILWQDNFTQIVDPRVATIGSPSPTAGVTTIPAVSGDNALVNGSDIGPELGILATPTINPSTNILYLVADTQELRNGATPTGTFTSGTTDIHYVQRLWAINISDGSIAITPTTNPPSSIEPTTGGQIIGDTILDPRSGSVPSFSSYNPTSFSITSLVRSGTTATATMSTSATSMHVGDAITISGASPAGYNGTFQITSVPSSTSFTFTVPSTLTTPATGTITAKWGANYKYVAGPFIKGTGNNTDTFNGNGTVATTNNADSWGYNTADTTSAFAGTMPAAAGDIAFNALLQMNRVATTLINGNIYLGFASHGDDGPYYGWLLGYNASTLANNAAFVTVPNFDGVKGSAGFTSVGGLWGSGGRITTDGTYLYFTVGNGSFNNATTNFNSNYVSTDSGNAVQQPIDGDYGDSILKVAFDATATQTNVNLANESAGNPTPTGTYNPTGGYDVNGYGLKVVDYFTPSNVRVLNIHDEDLGSGGTLLIPSTGPGSATAPNGDPMLVTAGKEGRIYLIDANNMGGFDTQYVIDGHDVDSTTNTTVNPAPYDRVLGEYYYRQANGNPTIIANDQTNQGYEIPSYFNGHFYVGLSKADELSFSIANFLFPSGVAQPNRTAIYATPDFRSATALGSRGGTAAISANGLADGIIWNNLVSQSSTDSLVAYDATGNGSSVIFSSNWTINGDTSNTNDTLQNGVTNSTAVKFSIPTVSNGMVYDGTGGGSGTAGHILGTVVGYGLLSSYLASDPAFFSAPNAAAVAAMSSTDNHVTWIRHSTLETNFEIDRSTNGSSWSVLAYVPNGTTSYDDATAAAGASYFYRVRAINGSNATGFTETAIFSGVSAADTFYLRSDPGNSATSQMFINVPTTGAPTYTFTTSGLSSITVASAGGNDALTVDFSNPGNPVPAGGLAYDGSSGTDSLTVVGTSSGDSISIGASTLTFGTTPITFANTESITINAGGGNDTLTQTAQPAAAVTFNGGTGSDTVTVNAGTFQFAGDPQGTGATASLTLNDNSNVTFAAAAPGAGVNARHIHVLNLGASATASVSDSASPGDRAVLVLGSLSVDATAVLNLGINDMIVHNGSITQVNGLLTTGYNGGAWTGKGINSSDAAGDATHHHAVGAILNGTSGLYTSWDGQSVTTSDVLVKYTLGGDATLDGTVDVSDLGILATNYGKPTGQTWATGDFTYDGKVDVSDLGVLATDYGLSGASSDFSLPAQVTTLVTNPAHKQPAKKTSKH